jgi:hypothetical protein
MMAAIHAATASPLTSELVADVRAEMTRWRDLWLPSLSGELRVPEATLSHAISHVMEETLEHVQIRFAATLASHGV